MYSRRINAMRSTSPPLYYIIVIEQIDVKRIIASATLFLEFKFTHEAGCLGRIGDIVVDKTVLDLFFPKILFQYLASLARHIGVFKLLLECNVDIISCYEELGFKKDTKDISLALNFKKKKQRGII
ncbi:unnamed protein product [Onchocerca flexuosa]|uniref:Glucosamine 6-phosphate N-acetyltransferase n=1 Tax=Onchocerca flexuosa TaxID=387005 RepID=A0A183HCE0_9BILA|nr:unnamed protein product [Onchocerca flexuosa]